MSYVVIGLFLVFIGLAVAGFVIHIRVLLHVKPGASGVLRKAMLRHNWDIAASQLEPAGQIELQRMRRLMDIMYWAGGLAFVGVVLVALFTGRA